MQHDGMLYCKGPIQQQGRATTLVFGVGCGCDRVILLLIADWLSCDPEPPGSKYPDTRYMPKTEMMIESCFCVGGAALILVLTQARTRNGARESLGTAVLQQPHANTADSKAFRLQRSVNPQSTSEYVQSETDNNKTIY